MSGFLLVGDARLEYLEVPAADSSRPALLLLHEGLGSVSMWGNFVAALASATGCRTIAYSRRGFGRSSPRTTAYGTDFMHREAGEVLPEIRRQLGLERPVLVGHSTGASMALLHAAQTRDVAAVVAMAPLATVEGSNLASIRDARRRYESSDWRERLARHHDDVDSVFYGWNDTWLEPDFAAWSIVPDLARIACPVLAILGEDDPYSSRAQVEAIARALDAPGQVRVLRLTACGHAPHREKPELVMQAITRLVDEVSVASQTTAG